MRHSDPPIGIRKNHLLWAVGAIVLGIILFFPSDFEPDSNAPATSAEADTSAAIAGSPSSPSDDGVTTFARSEPVSVGQGSEQKEITTLRQQMAGSGTGLSSPNTHPVASAAISRDVFAAGEAYTAKTSGCGNAAGCDRR